MFINTQADKVQNVNPNGQQPVRKSKQTRTVRKRKHHGVVGENIVSQPERQDELVPQPENKVLYSYLCISLCNLATLVIIMSILTKPMINKIL